MNDTYIEYPNYTLRIHVRNIPDDIETDAPVLTAQEFYRDFMREGALVRAPMRQPSGRDFAVIKRLLAKHETLDEAVRLFWREHSQPYFDRPDTSALLLFAKVLPDILRTR